MCLQEAHRTDEETSHLFLLPSHQRTHQDMHTPSGCHAPLSSTFSENGNAIALGRGNLLTYAASPGVSSVTSAPKVLQATDGLPCNGRSLSLIKIVTAQVLIGLLTVQDVIGNDENGVRDRHHCPLFAPSVGKPPSLRTQVGVFSTHGPLPPPQ